MGKSNVITVVCDCCGVTVTDTDYTEYSAAPPAFAGPVAILLCGAGWKSCNVAMNARFAAINAAFSAQHIVHATTHPLATIVV